jgi:hypothetical protein
MRLLTPQAAAGIGSTVRIRLTACRRLLVGAAALVVLAMVSQQAQAQYSNTRNFMQNFYANRPTVSPYLNLVTQQSQTGFTPVYQNMVRPQIEQRETQIRQDAEIVRIQNQLSRVSSDVQTIQSGNRGQFATGHPTRFMTYLHYYPALNRR